MHVLLFCFIYGFSCDEKDVMRLFGWSLEMSFRSFESQWVPGVWGPDQVCVHYCKFPWKSWVFGLKLQCHILILDFIVCEPAKFWMNTSTLLPSNWSMARSKIPEARSPPVDFSIQACWQCDLPLLLVQLEAEFLPAVSLHEWCGSRLLVLIVSTNLLIDASLLMWLFFLIATVMCQAH